MKVPDNSGGEPLKVRKALNKYLHLDEITASHRPVRLVWTGHLLLIRLSDGQFTGHIERDWRMPLHLEHVPWVYLPEVVDGLVGLKYITKRDAKTWDEWRHALLEKESMQRQIKELENKAINLGFRLVRPKALGKKGSR